MRGGRKQAKPDCGRPLDGRVRARFRNVHAASRCALTLTQPFNTDEPTRASELVFALHGLAVTLLEGLIEQPIVPLLRATSVRTRSEAVLPCIVRRLCAVSFASSLIVGSEEPASSLASASAPPLGDSTWALPRGRTTTGARGDSRFLRALTFDMRGGRQLAKPDVARPLDGRVRPRVRGKPLRCCAHPDL